MTTPAKSSTSSNPVGGEGGTPGLVEVEASETLTETVSEKSTLKSAAVTNPTGGEGGTPGA